MVTLPASVGDQCGGQHHHCQSASCGTAWPDPYLYQTFVEVWSGTNVVDLVAQPLGFRYFSVDPTNGFFLNGRHYDLHGVDMHQDWLNCGWALTNAQRDTNFCFSRKSAPHSCASRITSTMITPTNWPTKTAFASGAKFR